MSDIVRAVPVAGWYPDPGGQPLLRWWGGSEWTAHTIDPTTGQPPVAYRPMQSHTDYSSSYSAGAPALATSGRNYAGTSTGTVPIAILVLYPFLYAAGLWITIAATGILSPLTSGIVDLFALILLCGVAMWDHAVLESRGIPAASAFWMLLSPVGYLIARRVRLKKLGIRANAPGNAFVLSSLVALVLSSTVGTQVVAQINDRAAVDSMKTYVASTLTSKTSTAWTVNCPDNPPVATIGAVFICHATDTAGAAVDVTATVEIRDQFRLRFVAAQNASANT